VTRSAESYESEIRYWRDMCLRMNQKLQALNNSPEIHTDRGLTRDKTGDTAARNVDRQRRKKRN
jgi:hypothetical protein